MAEKNAHSSRRWVKDVKTDSTHPREGLFKKDAATIARELASKEVSPKGPGSGMRMLNYYINRGGKNLRCYPEAGVGETERTAIPEN